MERPYTYIDAGVADAYLINPSLILPPPPVNDSLETLNEVIRASDRTSNYENEPPGNVKLYDNADSVQLIMDALSHLGYEDRGDEDEFTLLAKDTATFTLNLQQIFGRLRPHQIAEYYELPFTLWSLHDVDTPAYPCLEYTQISVLALRASQLVKTLEDRKYLLKLTSKVAHSCVFSGRNFYSDVTASSSIATPLFLATTFGEAARKRHQKKQRKRNRRRSRKA
jgi:hypothetical protein